MHKLMEQFEELPEPQTPWQEFQLAAAKRQIELLDVLEVEARTQTELTRAIRNIVIGIAIGAFVAVCTIGLFFKLRADAQDQDIRRNRIVICDLYRQLDIVSPEQLDCDRLLGD